MIGTKLLASILAVGVVGGGAAGAHAIQSAVPSNQPQSYVNQEETATVEKQDQNEQVILQKNATITQEEATKTVLGKYQGGTINQVELDDEDGSVVYDFHVTAKDGKMYEVEVDAKTGAIIKAENDNENENEAVENDQEFNEGN